MYCVSFIILIITNKCTINITKVYITIVSHYVIRTPACFDIAMLCQGVPHLCLAKLHVHSCQQKSIGLEFSKSQTGNDVRYSCHHNSSHFTSTFPIFAHSCHFSVLHSLQSITPRIY